MAVPQINYSHLFMGSQTIFLTNQMDPTSGCSLPHTPATSIRLDLKPSPCAPNHFCLPQPIQGKVGYQVPFKWRINNLCFLPDEWSSFFATDASQLWGIDECRETESKGHKVWEMEIEDKTIFKSSFWAWYPAFNLSTWETGRQIFVRWRPAWSLPSEF